MTVYLTKKFLTFKNKMSSHGIVKMTGSFEKKNPTKTTNIFKL